MGLKSRHELPFFCENPIYNLTIQGRIVKFNFLNILIPREIKKSQNP